MNSHPGTQREGGANAFPNRTAQSASSGGAKALLGPSLRIPVTSSNRGYLRALRATESATWEQKPKLNPEGAAKAARAMLRVPLAVLAREKRNENRLYAGLACVSAVAVGAALWDSVRLFENWPTFVQFVQRLVG